MNKKNYIENKPPILRRFEETDIDDFFECCQNPNLGNNAGWKPHESKEESLAILKSFFIESENNVWAVVLKRPTESSVPSDLFRSQTGKTRTVGVLGCG